MKQKESTSGINSEISKTEFVQEVFPDELREIKDRRRAVFGEQDAFEIAGEAPSTDNQLVGLAFSGGGIRSATFNLGVAQALARHGILKYADYLSTVSGGGFIGATLSSLFNSAHTGPDNSEFPLRHDRGVEEPQAFRHLRNNSKYLAPAGLLDYLRIPALMLRGVLINFIVFLPYIVLLIFLTNLVYGEPIRAAAAGVSMYHWTHFYRLSGIVVLVFFLWIFLFPLIQWSMRKFFPQKYSARNRYELSFGVALLAVLGVALLESLPTALYYYAQWDFGFYKDAWTLGSALTALAPYMFSGHVTSRGAKKSGTILLYLLGLLGPIILLLLYLGLGNRTVLNPAVQPYIFFGAIALFIYTRFFLDVNASSLHNFYRDRLSRAYLFRVDANGEVQANDNQKIATLATKGKKAPYHLINVTLNLQACKDPNLRGRDADFFVLSKCYIGSPRTGFCSTALIEKKDRHLNLGTAIAISGAAAAPNAGTKTIQPLVAILTLLNIRLGYWLPNPRKVKQPGLFTFWHVGPKYLVKELFSKIDADGMFVNISDGGHIENLAIYELLRRRCKFIIAGDAEADKKMKFEGLAKLMRFARIDMAIDIDIELDDLYKDENGMSKKHWAFGRIDYGHGETGYLLYIKSSITGDENEYIREYRQGHTDFPHESTGDQFFDEAQFEVYRALGYHIVDKLFKIDSVARASKDLAQNPGMPRIEELFVEMGNALKPENSRRK